MLCPPPFVKLCVNNMKRRRGLGSGLFEVQTNQHEVPDKIPSRIMQDTHEVRSHRYLSEAIDEIPCLSFLGE